MRPVITFVLLAGFGSMSAAEASLLINDHGAVCGQAGVWSVVGSIGGWIIPEDGLGTGTFTTSGNPPVTVRPGNEVLIDQTVADPPALDVPITLRLNQDTDIEFAILAYDPNTGEPLEFSFGSPLHGSITILDPVHGRVRYHPDLLYHGPDQVMVSAFNAAFGQSTSATISIVVVPVNHAPVNTQRPIISGLSSPGQGLVGQTLTVRSGEWNDAIDGGTSAITITRVWQAKNQDGTFSDLAAAGASYLLSITDTDRILRLKETAVDSGGPESATAVSDEVSIKRLVIELPPTPPDGSSPVFPGTLGITIGLPFTYGLPMASGTVARVGNLPPGLTYDADHQRITGIPSGPAGIVTTTITVGNSTSEIAFTVNPGVPLLTVASGLVSISSYRLPDLTVGVPMQYQLPAVTARDGYDISGLPPGLLLDPTTGRLSGTPTAAGEFSVGVAIAAPDGVVVQTVYSFTVKAAPVATVDAPSIVSVTPPILTGGSGFSYRVSTSGAARVSVEGLPSTLSFDPQTGVISGTLPDRVDAVAIPLRIVAYGDNGQSTATGMTLDITPADPADPRLGNLPAQRRELGQPLTVDLPVTGDVSTVSFEALGVPPGMVFDPATRQITGTATETGWWQVVIIARRTSASAISKGFLRASSQIIARTTLAIRIAPPAEDEELSPWVRFRNNAESGFTGPRDGGCGLGGGVAILIGVGLSLAQRYRRPDRRS